MGINKINFGNTTLLDLTDATATSSKIIEGYTAYGKEGELLVGVAKGENVKVVTLEELIENYNNKTGFYLSYNNVNTGLTYVTNTVTTSKGIFVEDTSITNASSWFLEKVDGYNSRFYIYTYIDSTDTKYYMYNDTNGGANFMGLSTTSKAAFDISYEDKEKFLFKISTKNAWLQHSNGGGGIRLYTDHNNANNTQFSLTYLENAIVPFGTLTITENGTYDVTRYAQVIVNIN